MATPAAWEPMRDLGGDDGQARWAAVLRRERESDGEFVFGVTTTGALGVAAGGLAAGRPLLGSSGTEGGGTGAASTTIARPVAAACTGASYYFGSG